MGLGSCASAPVAGVPVSGDLMAIANGLKNGRNQMFARYESNKDIKWSKGAIWQLDFSGVAFDENRAATLISPVHVLMAAHHSRRVGETIIFHDRAGKRHEAKLVATKSGAGTDIAVGRLDRAIPISPYKVLPAGPDTVYNQKLRQEPVAVTNQHGQVFIHTIHHIANGYLGLGPLTDLNSGLAGKLVGGDSGHPSFLYQNGTMILIELHHFGGFGAGPFVSSDANFALINSLMTELGGGYQLGTKIYQPTPQNNR
jgi:hypothetical protein